MLLAIDVGNTNTVLGLMPDIGDPAQSWRLSSRQERTADEWRGLLDPVLSPHVRNGEIDAAIIGSVVPAVTGPLAALCRQWLGVEPIIVNASLDLGITLGQKEPQSVGVDRIANAVAAWQITGSASIVIDFGTATKLEAIDASGVFRGGVISPGLAVSRDALATLCRQWLGVEPIIVNASLNLGITLGQKEPQSVGVDRIANAVAAWQITGSASIVIDFGTATKLEAIDASGVFRGGVIAPGLGVSRDALATRAARLFAVELVAPDQAIGRDTISAVQSGLVLGHARMVEGLVGDLAKELDEPDPAILLTGGHAFAIQPILRVNATLYPDLTLYGLRSIFARNRPA